MPHSAPLNTLLAPPPIHTHTHNMTKRCPTVAAKLIHPLDTLPGRAYKIVSNISFNYFLYCLRQIELFQLKNCNRNICNNYTTLHLIVNKMKLCKESITKICKRTIIKIYIYVMYLYIHKIHTPRLFSCFLMNVSNEQMYTVVECIH